MDKANRLRITLIDREILSFLLAKGSASATNEITTFVGVSWKTVKRHLLKLQKLGLVNSVRVDSHSIFWEVIEQ